MVGALVYAALFAAAVILGRHWGMADFARRDAGDPPGGLPTRRTARFPAAMARLRGSLSSGGRAVPAGRPRAFGGARE